MLLYSRRRWAARDVTRARVRMPLEVNRLNQSAEPRAYCSRRHNYEIGVAKQQPVGRLGAGAGKRY